MDKTTALYIILALVVIFYSVVSYFSAKTWRALHVVLVVCIFFTSMVMTGLAACVLKTHDYWRTEYNRIGIELDEELRQIALLEEGIHHNASGVIEETDESIPKVRATLGRELLDRGRVWKNCLPGDVAVNSVTVDLSHWGESNCTHSFDRPDPPVEVPDAAPAVEQAEEEGEGGEPAQPVLAGPPPHGLEKDMVVYLFLEMPLAAFAPEAQSALIAGVDINLAGREEMCKVPDIFCGEFEVSDVEERSIKLAPTVPLSEAQLEALKVNATWVLFEMIPQDAHAIFADLTDEQLIQLLITMPQDAHAIFADLTDEQIQLLLMMPQDAIFADLTDEQIQVMKKDLKRHGDAVTDEDVENLWIHVKFIKDHVVDVDADDVSETGAGGDFKRDFNEFGGRTLSPWLRHTEGEGKVEFSIGDEALLDAHEAVKLIREQKCEEIERIYARPLRDYEFLFHNAYLRRIEMDDDAAVLNRQIELLEDKNKGVIERGDRVAAARTDEINKLKADLGRFQFELDSVQKHSQALQAQRVEIRSDMSRLYTSNVYLASRLAAIQAALKKQIDEQTRQAAATRP